MYHALPACAGSWPDPPPDRSATFPLMLSRSDRRTTLCPRSSARPPLLLTRPSKASSTHLSTEFNNFLRTCSDDVKIIHYKPLLIRHYTAVTQRLKIITEKIITAVNTLKDSCRRTRYCLPPSCLHNDLRPLARPLPQTRPQCCQIIGNRYLEQTVRDTFFFFKFIGG